ncbi:hypothetical protein BMS3Bbin04_01943 [bacterium BMS3Bbin04]|nr:hypothetical protein BMS3Bbin04_01943 [bacterium BMS3Bbin04]
MDKHPPVGPGERMGPALAGRMGPSSAVVAPYMDLPAEGGCPRHPQDCPRSPSGGEVTPPDYLLRKNPVPTAGVVLDFPTDRTGVAEVRDCPIGQPSPVEAELDCRRRPVAGSDCHMRQIVVVASAAAQASEAMDYPTGPTVEEPPCLDPARDFRTDQIEDDQLELGQMDPRELVSLLAGTGHSH